MNGTNPGRRLPAASTIVKRGAAWAADYAYICAAQLRAAAGRADAAAYAQGDRTPVLLLPGVYETWHYLEPIAALLHADGHPVLVVDELGYNRQSIQESARRVVARLEALGHREVIVVAHSKGGLIGKAVMSERPVGEAIIGMVALNTPFAGSIYASYFPSRTVRALRRSDPQLLALAEIVEVNGRIVSVFASFDPHVPGGSRLAGAVNVQVEAMGHFRIVADAKVQQVVRARVAEFDRV